MTYTEEQYNDVLRSTAAEMQALIAAHADAVKELDAKHAAQIATIETAHAEAKTAVISDRLERRQQTSAGWRKSRRQRLFTN